jgi:hypothetical protein
MINSQDFPHLTEENHRVTSPPSADYNCVAWSAADTEHWWQPGVYWPVETQPDDSCRWSVRSGRAVHEATNVQSRSWSSQPLMTRPQTP